MNNNPPVALYNAANLGNAQEEEAQQCSDGQS